MRIKNINNIKVIRYLLHLFDADIHSFMNENGDITYGVRQGIITDPTVEFYMGTGECSNISSAIKNAHKELELRFKSEHLPKDVYTNVAKKLLLDEL